MKIYLAHPFNSRKEIRNWQLDLSPKLKNIEFINPFYYSESVEQYQEGDENNKEYYDKLSNSFSTELVENDIKLIQEADAFVAVVDGQLSYGTIQEIVYAYINKKPVYIICTNEQEGHPWLKYHATKMFKNYNDFEKFIKKEDEKNGNWRNIKKL